MKEPNSSPIYPTSTIGGFLGKRKTTPRPAQNTTEELGNECQIPQLFDGRKKWDRHDSWRACVREKQRLWEARLRWWLARKRSRCDVGEGGDSRWSEIGEEKTRGWLTAGVELSAGGAWVAVVELDGSSCGWRVRSRGRKA